MIDDDLELLSFDELADWAEIDKMSEVELDAELFKLGYTKEKLEQSRLKILLMIAIIKNSIIIEKCKQKRMEHKMSTNKNPFNSLDKASKDEKIANAVSPLNQDRIDAGVSNIDVRILDWPDEKRMKILLSKMVKATIGGNIHEDIPEEIGEELFKGGLQTGLEAFNVSFEISGVSRAFTHQFVRTRKAAYHQQSSRYTYMGDKFNVRMPQTIADDPEAKVLFENFVNVSRMTYDALCKLNIPYQDARFTCPVGLQTYIVAEFPLKTFIDTYAYRACPMFQWEITYVFREMKRLLVEKLPFLDQYIKISCEKNKKCTFQGWESTEAVCDFPWNAERVFKSEHFTSDNTKE